jgi:hypothetical protein
MSALTLHERDASTLRAYIETGEMLLATYKMAGLTAMLQLHADQEMTTIAIIVSAMPDDVLQVLNARGVRHETVDFHEDEHRTVATYQVTLFQHDLAVVSVKWHARLKEAA